MANVIKSGRPPKSEVLTQIEELMPDPKGLEGASIRKRKDAARIAAEIALRTRPQSDIATAYGVNVNTLRQFRRNFVTGTVRNMVLQSVDTLQTEAAGGVTTVQNLVRESLIGVLEELEDLYRTAKKHIETHADDGDEYLARLGVLTRLLDTQGKNITRMSDAMAKQTQNENTVTPLSQHPQVGVLLEVLRTTFLMHPEARDEFYQLLAERKLILDE